MSKNNVKGLLKGLRYISHIFEEEEEEKEEEFQIGLPTDVKHVAHIGSDGPSASAPAWMSDFKSDPNASQQNNGDIGNSQDLATNMTSVKDSSNRDLSAIPKSRRQSSVDSIGSVESSAGSPTSTNKSKKSRKKHTKNQDQQATSPKAMGESSSSTHGAPSVPKKTRKKKPKESDGASNKSRERSSRKGSKHGSRRESGDESMANDLSNDAGENSRHVD